MCALQLLNKDICVGPRPARVSPLQYNRDSTRIGIVHFGPGAFHRGHQAVFTDDILPLDPSWAICGVSLKSADLRDTLAPQDNIYLLALLKEKPEYRLVGAIKELLVASESPEIVLARLAAPDIRIVTSTITEKGYCLTPEGDLDLDDPAIVHDLGRRSAPKTFIGHLVEGLRHRRDSSLAPFVPICCDNLSQNGGRLKKAVLRFARVVDPSLADWIEAEVPFPCTMVDSITPATDDVLRGRVERDIGVTDKWPIMREPFAQWIIEDVFGDRPRPPWDRAGVIFARDVRPYEEAKLRLLNGCHSALAYLGLLAGEHTVSEAMAVPALRSYLERMMREEICPGLLPLEGLDLSIYCQSILDRFANPHVEYRLSQIAWDGSQKIPIRLLNTLKDNVAEGRLTKRLSLAVAAWMKFSITAARQGLAVRDPLKERIFATAEKTTGDPERDVRAFLAIREIFSTEFLSTPGIMDRLVDAYGSLDVRHCRALLGSLE